MRGRKARVAKAAARYEQGWAKPHTELRTTSDGRLKRNVTVQWVGRSD